MESIVTHPIEHANQRILTTKQISELYGTDSKTIAKNFERNRDRYIVGKHYFVLEGKEKKAFLNQHQIDDGSKNAKYFYLWTNKGALLHAKSLGTDEAWEMYEHLIDEYFVLLTQQNQVVQEQKKERIFTQDVRRRCIENEKSIPDGYWCVVTEMWREAWSLESFMKELQPSRLPDGSCGRKWRQYLNEVHHPLLGKSYHYPLSAPHHQGRVEMWIYPMDLLYEFRCWLRREYAEYYDTQYSPSRVIDAPMKQVRGSKKKGELPPGGEK